MLVVAVGSEIEVGNFYIGSRDVDQICHFDIYIFVLFISPPARDDLGHMR